MTKIFPPDFTWGVGTSAFQIEGAYNTDGKGPSIWDAFCDIPGNIVGNANGHVACDHYHHFREDIALIRELGVSAYRFSISWPRIMPTGRDTLNPAGLAFYSDLIDALLENDIEPWVTLYHWDLPLALQMQYDGWLSDKMPGFFEKYAEVCFRTFGDRVRNWTTFNEPWVTTVLGHGLGVFAPGRTSDTEPYRAGHHILLAHGRAVRLYRDKFQAKQSGRIGITNNCDWREPATNKPEDVSAAQRALEFFAGWFTDPVYLGDYPETMKGRLGDALPTMTPDDAELIKGSADFLGLNHYATMYVADAQGHELKTDIQNNSGLVRDQSIRLSADPAWPRTDMGWPVVASGLDKLLRWLDRRYNKPEIIITENGCAYDIPPDPKGRIHDTSRIDYYRSYISAAHSALESGVNLTGYFAWSLMDNFEWAQGYAKRFGLYHIDYNTLQRRPKKSATWYKGVIAMNGLD